MSGPLASVGPASTFNPDYISPVLGPLVILGTQIFLTGLVNTHLEGFVDPRGYSYSDGGSFSSLVKLTMNPTGRVFYYGSPVIINVKDSNGNINSKGSTSGRVYTHIELSTLFPQPGDITAKISMESKDHLELNVIEEALGRETGSTILINISDSSNVSGKNSSTLSPIKIHLDDQSTLNSNAHISGNIKISLFNSVKASGVSYINGLINLTISLSGKINERFFSTINVLVTSTVTVVPAIAKIINILVAGTITKSMSIVKTVKVQVEGLIGTSKAIRKYIKILVKSYFKHQQSIVSTEWDVPTIGPDPQTFGEASEDVEFVDPEPTDFDYSEDVLEEIEDFSDGTEVLQVVEPEDTDFDYSEDVLEMPIDVSIPIPKTP